ncbi:MAG: hypothetical protein R3B13_22420 [Polyangiaceae bacterium]
MPSWLKHICFVLFLVVFAGCAGSCSSCSGCGMTPLPGGFKSEGRIENAASVRLTDSGLKFLGDNLGAIAPSVIGSAAQTNAGVVTFDVPPVAQEIKLGPISLGTAHVCKAGSKPTASPPECIVEADLGKAALTLATKAPHNLTITGTLAVRLQKAPLEFGIINSDVVLTAGGKCSPRDYANIPVTVDISVEVDDDPNHGTRKGYSKVKIETLTIDNNTINNSIGFCGSALSSAVLNFAKGFILGSVTGGLTDTLKSTVEDQLCTSQDPAAGVTCPSGTYPDPDGVCRYCNPDGNGICQDTSRECVALALGTDGNINLSQALSSLSPGTKGGFDFMMAVGGEGLRDDNSGFSWGDLNFAGGGATLGLMGGAEPTPITQCVPIANLTKPTGIPIPDELTANTVSGWTGDGPHLGLALSERYLNYTLGAVYNSGALCIGVGSSTLGSLLNSDTIGLLIPSLKDLARQRQAAPLALVLRPQEPPSATVGNGTDLETDPLLALALNKLSIDFYVWSNDRFIRGFTATFDVLAPVNLDVTNEGLAPVIDKVEINNPDITNGPLLREETKAAAKALAGIIGSQLGSALGGAINPINLNDSLASAGLTLTIPPTVQGQGSPGLRKLEKGTDRFLGIFAALGLPAATNVAPEMAVETVAEVTEKRVDERGLSLPTLSNETQPEVRIRVSSPADNGANKLEYQYRVNGGIWHPWTYERDLAVRTPDLALQAVHHIDVRARIAGKPHTMDLSPVRLDVRIDKTAPFVEVARRPRAGKVEVFVRDTVSERSKVRVRYALDDDAFGQWQPADSVQDVEVGGAGKLRVEAEDEEGNVASVQQSLIRGKEDASLAGGGSGCNCTLVGGSSSMNARLRFGFPALLALGLALWARRRRPARGVSAGRQPEKRNASLRRARTFSGLAMMAVAVSYSGCSCGDDSESKGGTGGGPAGACPGADTCEVLEPGLIGAYASGAVAADGVVWVAAYNDFGYGIGDGYEETYNFGDLVVGKLDGDKVTWSSVDGLPAVDDTLDPGSPGGPPDPDLFDPNGYRSGLTEPGDDVGLWTSMAFVGGQPAVAYYDGTNHALRFARYDGKSWTSHEVQKVAKADVGRYAKLVAIDDKPVIAYLAIEPGGTDGMAKSVVRVARAASATPDAGGWTFEDAAVDPLTPCSAAVCGGDVCVSDNGKCAAKIGGCDPKCGSGEACVDIGAGAQCAAIVDANTPITYPEAAGLYISLAKTAQGLGIAYYDRIHGNLMAVRKDGATWQAPVLVDGQGSDANGPVDTGDVGLGASLFVDGAGDWHLSYVNGFDETVIYMKLTGGTTPSTPEVVDDGATADGQAVVGDDSAIFVTGSGEVRIAYQDATNGTLRWAVGTPNGATHTWNKKSLTVPGFSAGFNQILDVGGATKVLSFWREGKPKTRGDVALISP